MHIKINEIFRGNSDDLDIVMQMYNLLECNNSNSMTSGRLWNYYRDEVNDGTNENSTDDCKLDDSKKVTSKSFVYKKKIIGSTAYDNNT